VLLSVLFSFSAMSSKVISSDGSGAVAKLSLEKIAFSDNS